MRSRTRPGSAVAAGLATLVVLAVLASGCSAGEEAASTAQPTSPAVAEAVAAPSVVVGEPQWTTLDSSLGAAVPAGVGERSILVRGDASDGSGPALQVVDRATGETRWERTGAQPLVVGDGADRVTLDLSDARLGRDAGLPVIVPYAEGRRRGLVALSQGDGTYRWRWSPPAGLAARTAGVGSDVVVVRVAPPGRVDDPTGRPDDVSTLGLDLTTGEVRWRVDGVAGAAATGGVVVASVPSTASGAQTVVLLDDATGEETWRSPQPGYFAGGTDDVYALTVPGQAGAVLVDAATERVEQLQTGVAAGSGVGGDALLAWVEADHESGAVELATLASGEDRPVTAPLPATVLTDASPRLLGTTLGHVVVQGADGVWLLDRAGRLAGEQVPGRLDRVLADGLVLVTGTVDGAPAYEVLGLETGP